MNKWAYTNGKEANNDADNNQHMHPDERNTAIPESALQYFQKSELMRGKKYKMECIIYITCRDLDLPILNLLTCATFEDQKRLGLCIGKL